MPLQLDPQDEATSGGLSYGDGAEASAQFSVEDANAKAARVVESLDEEDKKLINPVSVAEHYANGNEDLIQEALARSQSTKNLNRRTEMLQQIAARKQELGGGPLSPAELSAIQTLNSDELNTVNPYAIVEKKFGDMVSNRTAALNTDKYEKALTENPDTTDAVSSAQANIVARQEVLRTQMEKARKRTADQSWVGYGADLGKSLFIPLYGIYSKWGAAGDENALTTGAMIRAQRMHLLSVPTVEQFKQELEKGYEAIAVNNPQMAEEWLHQIAGMTTDEGTLNSFFDLVDIASLGAGAVGSAAKIPARAKFLRSTAIDAVDTYKRVARDVAKVSGGPKAKPQDMLLAAGEQVDAATVKAANIKRMEEELAAKGSNKADSKYTELLSQKAPSLNDPAAVFDVNAPTRINNEFVRRFSEQSNRFIEKATRLLTDLPTIARLDEGSRALTSAVDATVEQVRKMYGGHVRNAVMDTEFVPASDTRTNVGLVRVKIGRPSGEAFDSVDALDTTMQKYYGFDKDTYSVESFGGKYYAVVEKNVDETLRDVTIEAKNATPVSTWSFWPKRYLLSADSNLSKAQGEVRKVLVAASAEYQRVYQQLSEPLAALSKRQRQRHDRIVTAHRDYVSPDGVRGRWANTINEFDEDFIKMFNQAPTDAERLAYFNYRQLSDLDYMVRNLDLFRNRASKGIEDWTFKIDGATTAPIQGRYVDALPWDNPESFQVMIVEADGKPKVLNSRDVSPSERDRINTLISNNHRGVVQIPRPVEMLDDLKAYLPKNYEDMRDPINFVVSTNPQRRPLSHQQIPYREGGHVVNDVRYFVKNANIQGQSYLGDLTFSGHVTEREAQDFAKTLEEGRRLYLQEQAMGKKAAQNRQILDDWVAKNLPFTGDEFRQHFLKGTLNKNAPIVVLKDGMRYSDIADLRTQGIRDFTKSAYNIDDSLDKAFTREKGEALYNFKKGSPGNPAWGLQQARTLNPTDSLNQALRSAIQSRLHTDYVVRSANEFVEQFHPLMAVSLETMRANPVYWLYHPQWRDAKKAYDADQTAKVIKRTVETTIPARARQTAYKGAWGTDRTNNTQIDVELEQDLSRFDGGQAGLTHIGGNLNGHEHLQDLTGTRDYGARRFPVPDWFADGVKLVNQLTERLDMPNVKVWYSDHAMSAKGMYRIETYEDAAGNKIHVPTIVIGRNLTREDAVRTIAHELGHAADFAAMRVAPQATRDAIRAAYQRYIKNLDPKDSVTKHRVTFPGTGSMGGLESVDKGFYNYITNFEEWFAEETAKWLLTRKKPMGVVEKFFEGLAAKWKEIYQTVMGQKTPSVNKDIAAFLTGRWREDKTVRKEILETVFPPPPASDQTLAAMNAGKTMREAVISLIETPSDVKAAWDSVKNRMLNSVYEKYGAERAQWLDELGLFKTNDPIRFARSIAFHTKIGLFNPVQLFLNAQTMFHAAAISPTHALPAFRDASILFYRFHTPSTAIGNKLRGMSSYKYFAELEKFIQDSGINIVGGGHANLDDFLEPKMIQSAFGKFLDTGTMFFRMSEEMVRLNATAIAHREWRKINPNGRLDDNGKRWITARADTLSVNMTRASNAAYQKGFGSIPFQFTSYATRMSEQILTGLMGTKGAQLTRAETARVMGGYATLYGVPTAAAASLGIFPIQEMFKEHASYQGYDINHNLAARTFTYGLLNLIADYAVGEPTNLSERYGPNGTTILSDLSVFGGEKGAEVLLGASGSIAGDILSKSVPLLTRTAGLFTGANKEDPLVVEDFLDVARSISTVDNATKMFMALKWGQYITKNEVAMTDVNGYHAITMGLLGLTPREVTDSYTDKRIMGEAAKAQQQIVKEVVREIQRAYRSYDDGNPKEGEKYFKRAQALIAGGDFNPTQQASILSLALSSYKGDIDGTNMKMLRNAPTPEIYQRRLDKTINTMENK